MAEAKNVEHAFGNTLKMVEQLRKSLDELESHGERLLHEKSLLEDIKQHFNNIKKLLQKRFDELEIKERAFEEKKAKYQTFISEKEASVNTKEQDLFDRLQVVKDVAVSSIIETYTKYKASLENKVSISAYDDPNAPAAVENIDGDKLSSADAMPYKVKLRFQVKQLCEQMNAKGLVKCISDNRKMLVSMHDVLTIALRCAKDPALLVLNAIEAFYPQNQFDFSQQSKDNNLQFLRRTCFMLLESAAPLLGLAVPGSGNALRSEIKQRAKKIADEWKARLAATSLDASNGYSLEAISFLQLLVTYRISSEFDEDQLCKFVVSVSRHRKQATELCRVLGLAHKAQDVVQALVNKGRHIDAAHFSHAFQLTEIFPLVPLLKQYLEDMKKNLALIDTPGSKPHPTNNYRSRYYTPFQRDTANQELGVLKAVIKCIEDYKLQEEYPPDALHARVAEIEEAKADKKRTPDVAPVQMMKPLADGGYASLWTPFDFSNRVKPLTNCDEGARYYASGDNRYLYAAPTYEVSGYGGENRYLFAAHPANEVSFHAPHVHQSSASRPYHHQDNRVPHHDSGDRVPHHDSDDRVPHASNDGVPTNVSLSNYGRSMNPPIHSTPGNYGNYMSSGMQQLTTSNYGSYTGSNLTSSHQLYM